MLGVVSTVDKAVVKEFFELFKTPWEYYRPGVFYKVILSTEDEVDPEGTELLILCTAKTTNWDRLAHIQTAPCLPQSKIQVADQQIPIYGSVTCFSGKFKPLCWSIAGKHAVGFDSQTGRNAVIRIGYNILDEVRYLLAFGQASESAALPTVEIHIDLVRQSLIRKSIPFVEIPPVPSGRAFFVGLSHDVDFYRLRDHFFDQTFYGFCYRALLGELLKSLRGAGSLTKMLVNWWTLLKLPFIYLRMTCDPWPSFKHFAELDQSRGATYYIIPFKHQPGRNPGGGWAPASRATRYDISDINKIIRYIEQCGYEIGLHGINAWYSPIDSRLEASRLSRFTTTPVKGVRMHWLYFTAQSHNILEQAGFLYDSTVGYNDAVGFKSGTAQAYQPPGSQFILELPMILQDSALFYASRLNLSEEQARLLVEDIINKLRRYGGCLTINWHHRSLAPERLWGDFYTELLQLLEQHRGCFWNSSKIVEWYNKRRQTVFREVNFQSGRLCLNVDSPCNQHDGFVLRIYHPAFSEKADRFQPFYEMTFTGNLEREVRLADLEGTATLAD